MIARLIFITAFFLIWCGNVSADSDAKKSFKKTPKAVELYVTVRPDFRKCISPICGGWYVNPVNRRVMKCPDGSVRKECYVGTDEINIKHLTDEQINELRQAMYDSRVLIYGNISNAIDYGLFSINKAWISANSQPPSGKFVNVSDNGIR
ncbi:MAG: hypothetical protein OEX07_14075, partial [Gammaproteobacteria bacterium]|nr:hypothetical protein [Gammaproteobacteria bacterium]